MITIRPGSHVYHLIQLLTICGEYPTNALHILGAERSLKQLVHKLESKQSFRTDSGTVLGQTRLFSVIGKRPNRSIRFYKGALPILDSIYPDALKYYLDAFCNHRLPYDANHVLRNHRVAETMAMCMSAGIEFRPYELPQLQNTEILTDIPGHARFYVGRNTKKLSGDEFNKTMYSRTVGLLFYPGGHYAVYNTRSSVMKWGGSGEIKAALSLDELARWNNGGQPQIVGTYSAVLFGQNQQVALNTLREAAKDSQKSRHFHNIYNRIHFIPLNPDGIRLLKILTLPYWEEKILDSLFPPEMRTQGYSNFDAQRDGVFYISHLDSDIAKIIRFKQMQTFEVVEILCYSWQEEFLRSYLRSGVRLKQIDMAWLENQVGLI